MHNILNTSFKDGNTFGLLFIAAGTKNSKKHIGISDEIISTPMAEDTIAPAVDNTLDNVDSVDGKVRRRHKNKPQKDSERTLLISKSSEDNSQNISQKVSIKSTKESVQHRDDTLILKEKQENGSLRTETKGKSEGQGLVEVDSWSQNQQVVLEWALKQYPKGSEQRWEKIAEHVPGKTKVC